MGWVDYSTKEVAVTKQKRSVVEVYPAQTLFDFTPNMSDGQRAFLMGVSRRTLCRWRANQRMLPWVIADELAVRLGYDLETVWELDLLSDDAKGTGTTMPRVRRTDLSTGTGAALEA